MSDELPQGWEVAELGTLGRWRGGGTPSKSVPAYWTDGTVHWVSPKDMKRLMIDSAEDQITLAAVEKSAANLIPKDSVLMVTRSGILEHTFPVAINTVEVTVNQDLKAWTPHPGINSTYAAYYLKAEGRAILDHCSKDGTTVASIDFDRLKTYPFRLAPESEQSRIVSKIEELFSSIDEGERALERVRKLVERYRQSVLKAAVTGELTREWREQHAGELESGEALLNRILQARRKAWETAERANMTAKKQRPVNDLWKRKYKEPEAPDTPDLPELPHGWVWGSIGQVGFVSGGLTKNKARHDKGHTRPYLRVANVYANRLDLEEISVIGVGDSELDRVLLQKDDLLVVEGNGSIGQVGRVALWDGSVEGCVHQNHIIKVRLTSPDWAWYALIWCLSPPGRTLIEQAASSTAGLHTLSITKIETLPIPIPSGTELASIRDQFECMASLVLSQQADLLKSMKRASALRQSVLRSAFDGGLVAQDPADEPASVLLERIAAQRATAASDASAAKEQKRKSRFPSGMTKKTVTTKAVAGRGKAKA